MDGQAHRVPRKVVNDRPIKNEYTCSCGGTVYVAASARYSSCSDGAVHCNTCRRVARRHGKAYTCGICPGKVV